jgi:2'-5' RNA ligase
MLSLSGIGSFSHRRGHTWWAGIAGEALPLLMALERALGSEFRDAGFSLERRAFRPHVTIARNVQTTDALCLDVPQLSFALDEVSLMSSVLGRDGARYAEIDTVRLHG